MMMMNHYPMNVFPLAPFNHKFMEVLYAENSVKMVENGITLLTLSLPLHTTGIDDVS